MKTLILALLIATLCACHSARPTPEWSQLILHIDYRSGGDAPWGQLLTFFPSRRVRLHSPEWKERWTVLSEEEWLAFTTALNEARPLLVELDEDGYPFACCDYEEIGLYLSHDSHAIGLRVDPPEHLPSRVHGLLVVINGLGRRHFGRHFSSLPTPASRRLSTAAGHRRTGPVVDFVNQVRSERCLPLRASYLTEPAAFGGSSKFQFKGVDPKRPKKIH